MAVIDPTECIDCGNWVYNCPVQAIQDLKTPRADGPNSYWGAFNDYDAPQWARFNDIAEELPQDLNQFKTEAFDDYKCLAEYSFHSPK